MKKQTLIQLVVIAVLVVVLAILARNTVNEISSDNQVQMKENPGQMSSSSSAESTGATEVTDEQTLTGEYETGNEDESVIKVSDGGNLTLEDATISKTGGDSSNTENSEFYGVNAGILTTENSTTTIKNATISTNAKGSNAVFATGENAEVYISDSEITTTGESSSRGLDATYGGYIEADNVTISTLGRKLCNSCNR